MQFSTQHLQIPQRSWTKQELLEQLSPEQVMERLGLPVDEIVGQQSSKFASPLREDRKADCRLRYSEQGTLYFHDPQASTPSPATRNPALTRHECGRTRKNPTRTRSPCSCPT